MTLPIKMVAAVFSVALMGLGSVCFADIVSTGGNATLIPRPADAETGALVSLTDAYVWSEAQQFTLTAPLAVDAVNPGTYKKNDLSTSYLPVGTELDSYSFSFVAPSGEDASGAGTITFNLKIIAVIATNNPGDPHLDESNYLGLGTQFSTGQKYAGLDGGEPITISPDSLTFSYSLSASTPGDRFRILTEIPEPAATGVFGTLCLLFLHRTRRARVITR
jgi:hypothetical protein